MRVRIGTFNVENLFARFRFKDRRQRYRKPDGSWGYRYRPLTDRQALMLVRDGWKVDKTKFRISRPQDRLITAAAIQAIDAHILALQEVENLDVLKRFNAKRDYLDGMYHYKLVVDGNDPRLIDVGLLCRKDYPITSIRTHQFLRTSDNRAYVFSRDCLEVTVALSNGAQLPIFINHFKSMVGGREQTMDRRRVQATAVRELLERRFGADPGSHKFVVLGDLNDYMPSTGLDPLVGLPWLVNVVQERIPNEDDKWTHYYKGRNQYKQLDYVLLSKALADANPGAVPIIERRGLPKRATEAPPARFPGVGYNSPKASDHCPVAIDIDV